MVQQINRHRVQELRSAGAIVLDVLPEHEYTEEHLPGALNVPLHQLASWASGAPDPHAAVIVYCYDTQ